jgi:hypothetical protein
MSVISILESTPNRVRALVRLSAIVGPSSRATLKDYFMPGGDSGGQFNNLIRETIRLGFLVEQSSEVTLGPDIESKNVADDEWFLEFLDRQLVIDPKTEIIASFGMPLRGSSANPQAPQYRGLPSST